MFNSFETARDYIDDRHIRMIDLKWCDYAGHWHHVTLSAPYFTTQTMRDGVGFDASSVGFKPVNAGDMVLIPDLASGFIDPFYEEPTLSFISDIHDAKSKQQFSHDPRDILRRAENHLRSNGLADNCLWGPEFEFYLFNEADFKNEINTSYYHFSSSETDWEESELPNGYLIPPHAGYHRNPPSDHYYNLRSQMCLTLENLGIPIKYHHHESGCGGHSEIEISMLPSMKAGDVSLLIRYVVKMSAVQSGLTATFLPKPLYGEAGSGMHFHQQLVKGNKNLFYDAIGYNQMSQIALYYIGGLLTHAPALTALTNPSTNSYRRLIPGFEAPFKCFFGGGNRSAAIRIPSYATDPADVRLEYRPPDGTCNPYLAMAAMLLAGMDGIVKKIDPTRAGFGPYEEDLSSLPVEQRPVMQTLPETLENAAQALMRDHVFLLAGNVFDEELIDYWVKARVAEHRSVAARPHPYEISLYYDS